MSWLLYLATGVIAGFLAGLLGVGGGLIMVPALGFIFLAEGFPAGSILHLALGTSLAVIAFTSMSSMRAHHARGAVNWGIVRAMAPGIVSGTLAGTVLADRLSTQALKFFFVAFLFAAATQMLTGVRPNAHRGLPGPGGMFGAGGVIGAISALVGIGGGTMTVPFLAWCSVKLHKAIGTSAAIGLPIAIAGAAGFMLVGWNETGLPPGSIGFVSVPALVVVAAASVLTAPLGARAAHALPVPPLRRIFAVLLYILGIRMAYSLT